MNIDSASYSDIGSRAVNEDSLLLKECSGGFLAMVADGLGGYGNGDAASQCAVSVVAESLDGRSPTEDSLSDAVLLANQQVLAMQTDGKQMKTTAAVLWLGDTEALLATVGDTRIYQFRNGEIIFQTTDHSVSQLAVMVGLISAEGIRGDKDRNKLTRALGAEQTVKVDTETLQIEAGDSFLLCSDGFWELVWESQMCECLRQSDNAAQWLDAMRKIAAEAPQPKKDNNTAVVLTAR